ncbi:hypothetical protein ACVGOW_08475 [Pseudonocardia saturnea]
MAADREGTGMETTRARGAGHEDAAVNFTITHGLRIDGRWFCDQPRAHALVGAGLLVRASAERSRATVPARLTDAGRVALRS